MSAPTAPPAAPPDRPGPSVERPKPHAVFQNLRRLTNWLSVDFLGGPRPLQQRHIINFQKGGTLPFVAALMLITGDTSTAAWVYLALHGSYGLAWLIKDAAFRDPGWDVPVTLPAAVNCFLFVLGPYWLAPVVLMTDLGGPPPEPSGAWLALCAVIYAIGLVLMMASDAHKHFVLKVRRGLITEGLFSRIRHPNYLGEMLIYGSFALLTQSWIPWVVLAFVWGSLFSTNIAHKEASMSRYPEWAAYKAKSGVLLPKLWGPRS